MKQKPKLVFFGTPEFAVPALEALVSLYDVLVVTQPDKPVGRKQELTAPPIKTLALKKKLTVLQPEKIKENQTFLQHIREHDAPVAVVVAYGKILPQELLNLFPRGVINIHPSLLPRYRGSSPIQTAIMNGDAVTGISIMLLDNEMDHGPILEQEEVRISVRDTAETLHDKLAQRGAELLVQALTQYFAGTIQPWQQDHSEASFTKMIERSDGKLNWTKSADELERQFRAFYPWPGVFSLYQQKRLKIGKLRPLEGFSGTGYGPGEVFLTDKKQIAVACGNGAVLIDNLQLEGKSVVSAKEFITGQQAFVGSILD